MAKFKLFLAALALVAGLAVAWPAPAALAATGASQDAKDAVCDGITTAGGNCSDSGKDLSNVVKVVIRVISAIAGVAAVIMIILGGFRYITSGGDSSKVASAKNTIIYALVGLVIVAMAQFIVRYVAKQAT